VLGLSLTEIVFTVLLIVAVWRGFKLYESLKVKDKVEDIARRAHKAAEDRRARKAAGDAPTSPPVDLVACPRCGAYHPRGTRCDCKRG
jgi:ribosomal protein L32